MSISTTSEDSESSDERIDGPYRDTHHMLSGME